MSEAIQNAKIIATMLGREDHNIPTCSITLEFGPCQGFGGHDLRFESYGIDYLFSILDTVGVREWEKLVGQYVRIKRRGGKIVAIGHITSDNWFEPEADGE